MLHISSKDKTILTEDNLESWWTFFEVGKNVIDITNSYTKDPHKQLANNETNKKGLAVLIDLPTAKAHNGFANKPTDEKGIEGSHIGTNPPNKKQHWV